MPILAVVFYGLTAFGLYSLFRAIRGEPRWYGWAALASYVCSFLSGFSIGLLVLSVTFVTLVLGLGHRFRLLRSPWYAAVAVPLGLALWWLAVTNVDDYWLFLPFALLQPWLSA